MTINRSTKTRYHTRGDYYQWEFDNVLIRMNTTTLAWTYYKRTWDVSKSIWNERLLKNRVEAEQICQITIPKHFPKDIRTVL